MSTTGPSHLQELEPVVLTPSKRKRRPRLSYSPQKPASPAKKLRSWSSTSENKPKILVARDTIDGGDLVFSDGYISWDESKKTWRFLPDKYMDVIVNYLTANFKIGDVMVAPPFISIYMEPGEAIPRIHKRPFRIADLLCLWVTASEPRPQPFPANHGVGYGEALTLPDEIAKSFEPGKFPPRSTMEFLVATYFPTALAISYFLDSVIVELPQTDMPPDEESLPSGFINCPYTGLRFSWGELTTSQVVRRKIKPYPALLSGDVDDTHYIGLENGNLFAPGMRVFNSLGDEWTSGIFVQKNGEVKVTVPIHAYNSVLGHQRDDFSGLPPLLLFQGNEKQHSEVARLNETINFQGVRTDIGLASIKPELEHGNRTFHDNIIVQKLIRIEECSNRDMFLIDSYITGVQRLLLDGTRYPVRQGARATQQYAVKTKGLSSDELPSPKLQYLELAQGMFSTAAIEIPRQPQIRAGVCGSAVIRIRTSIGKDVSAEGAVAGFMHFADLEPKNDIAGNLLCYADSCNALIDQGWSVC